MTISHTVFNWKSTIWLERKDFISVNLKENIRRSDLDNHKTAIINTVINIFYIKEENYINRLNHNHILWPESPIQPFSREDKKFSLIFFDRNKFSNQK